MSYLSPQWIAELGDEVRAHEPLQAAARGRTIGITQVVEGGPNGSVVYHLQADADGVRCSSGPADPEHLRFVESWEIANAVASGEMNAQDAFIKGRIRFHGDQQLLLDHVEIFQALAGAVTAVRARTTFETTPIHTGPIHTGPNHIGPNHIGPSGGR